MNLTNTWRTKELFWVEAGIAKYILVALVTAEQFTILETQNLPTYV